jgi:phenylacetate-CoA ligase
VKVRGLFLHPVELDRAMARHPEVIRYQATVTRGADHQDILTVAVEVHPGDAGELAARLAQSIRETTRFRADVTVVAPGTLPADARKILDRRRWE